jgi:mannan endo-1,4-beta-mannosidase
LRGVRLRRLVKTAAAVSAVVLVLSGSAYAQVKLNAATQPATVVAGNTAYLTGSGFPSGTIAPGQVTIALAGTCLGTPVSTAAAASVTNVIGTSKRISFVAPLSVSSGVYYVSIAGTASSGAFASNNCSTTTVQNTSNFVSAGAGSFWLHGSPFRFGGTNIYSPMYSNRAGVDALLGTAHAAQQNVVRTWTWIDIGGNGTPSIKNAQNGFYFQYWPVNGAAPAYNDGTNGLQNLDYTIYRAGQLGMKLIMAFTNNWNDFGGMDQYVAWRGLTHHSDFYTDPTIRQWYKDWIGHLLNRVNTLTGIPYKDDPTIMMWELANEPRCGGSDGTHYPAASTCNPQTLVSWVQDVASYVKTVDPLHLLAVGDEGFYCKDPKSSDWTMNCTQGGDTVGFAQAPAIDAMSMHLYPDSWSKNLAWSQTWITQHLTDAAGIGKPAYLGEYGWSTQNTRLPVYFNWSNAVLANGGLAALQWDIIPGSPAPAYSDPTGFDLYAGSPELLLLNNFSQMMAAGQTLTFPPVAGNQSSTTAFNTPIVLNPMQNDVAYGNATINPLSVDLDPNTPGQQTSVTTGLGTFAAQPDGTVLYTPAATYSGPALATYTVQDTNGATSNVASLVVTVGANPNATQLTMFSFEDGTADGWGPVNSASNGAVQATTAFHTDGIDGLQLNVAATDWFGATLTSNANLSSTGKFHSSLQVDVQTLSTGTSVNLQFTAGSSSNWCQGNSATVSPSFIPANTTATVTLDLTNLSALTCFGGTLTDTNMRTVKAVHLLLNPGTYNLDYFRAQ